MIEEEYMKKTNKQELFFTRTENLSDINLPIFVRDLVEIWSLNSENKKLYSLAIIEATYSNEPERLSQMTGISIPDTKRYCTYAVNIVHKEQELQQLEETFKQNFILPYVEANNANAIYWLTHWICSQTGVPYKFLDIIEDANKKIESHVEMTDRINGSLQENLMLVLNKTREENKEMKPIFKKTVKILNTIDEIPKRLEPIFNDKETMFFLYQTIPTDHIKFEIFYKHFYNKG